MSDDTEEKKVITRAQAKALGLSRYFTGKPCKHGHVAERKVSNTKCIVCYNEEHKMRLRKLRKEKPEQYVAYSTKYRLKNPEKVKNIIEKWRKENPENLKATNDTWRKNNPEKVKVNQDKWRAKKKAEKLKF